MKKQQVNGNVNILETTCKY